MNPRATEIRGLPCYASVRDLPEALELAVIAVPLPAVMPVVDDCIAHGVGGLVVITSGFREVGAEGAALEGRLAWKVRDAGIPMLGPNCMGFFNTSPDARIDITFSPVKPRPGRLAFLSQSGALAVAVLSLAESAGIGFSFFASLGNEATLTHRDLLEYAAADPQTRVIILYLESFSEAAAFLETARRVTRPKPVVCLKGGRTEGGARAARSHTGALATSARVMEAVMKQSGVILVDTTEELLDVANALGRAPVAHGRRVRILTNAGGPGVLAADHVLRRGLELPPLSAAAQAALRAFVPSQAATGNPVDLTAAGTPLLYADASRVLLDDPETDALLAVLVTPPGVSATAVRTELQRAACNSAKPVVAAFVAQPELLRQPEEQRLATVAYPESAAVVLDALCRKRRGEPPAPFPNGSARLPRRTGVLDLAESFHLLKKYGIPVVRYAFVRTGADLAAAGKRVGFPLAMKAVSPDVIHKTESGGVALNIASQVELRRAFTAMSRLPLRGVLLQPMVSTRRELILGFRRDEDGTPMVLAGLGGVLAEALDAVSLRVLPVTCEDVVEMLTEIPGSALLGAFRGWPPMDRGRLVDVILRLAQLGSTYPQISEIDINPLVEPCHALDARILLSTDEHR